MRFERFVWDVICRASAKMPVLLIILVYITRTKSHLHIVTEDWACERVFLSALPEIVLTLFFTVRQRLHITEHWALATGVFGKRDVNQIERVSPSPRLETWHHRKGHHRPPRCPLSDGKLNDRSGEPGLAKWFSKFRPEPKPGGKAPQYKSTTTSLGSRKSGPDPAKNSANGGGSGSRVEFVGIIVIDNTPTPLTLEQQHITAVEGIVPTLQNIVTTVNLDCQLGLKTIVLHARNAEYNPKVRAVF